MGNELELAGEKLDASSKMILAGLEGVNDIVAAAKFVPLQYFAKRTENIDEETFIVKKKHVEDIKRYVAAGLSLPVDISKVEDYLGYVEVGHKLLKPTSMQEFFQNIHQHALSWSTLERKTKDVGNRLDLFASKFYEAGLTIIKLLEATESYKRVEGSIEALSEDEKAQLDAIPLSSDDTRRVKVFRSAIQYAKKEIAEFYLDVGEVNALAIEFSRKISDELLIELKHKMDAVDEANIDRHADIKELRLEIIKLDDEIAYKQSVYDRQKGYAFTGLIFGPLGLVVTGGIFGAQAEQTRAEKNALIARKEVLVSEMSGARLSQRLITLTTNLSEMRSLMKDAESGIKCIEDVLGIVWNSIGVSLEEFDEEATTLELILLVLNLRAIFNPWKTIQGHAKALSNVFNQIVD